MNYRRISSKILAPIVSLAFFMVSSAQAAEIMTDTSIIDEALSVLEQKNSELAEIQGRINRLANATSSTFEQFKQENDNLEALLVLNAEYRQLVSIQEQNIETLDESIANVEVVTREIPLLIQKMITSIEQFVELDLPFQLETRRNRITFARNAINNPDVSIAEKFRQILVLYQNETLYGRTHETYPDTINLDGQDREVNLLRVGRIALLFQTTDRQVTGRWNNDTRSWETLPAGDYRTAVQSAIRVSSGLDAPRIIELPIAAPELAQ
ncbi:MAG: DUF3450 domain-containing protein [Gammaproteobacteria bacterium]|nr:DUF3450 domain-containing protein [Pseudomonadales bacterium]MCP5346264.1 DUF3450 domain-containing protein [Pseudomonadales bacterium]